MARPRITWNKEEWDLVTARARELGVPIFGDSESVWKLMQNVLPQDRHRPFDPQAMSRINKERAKGPPRKQAEALAVAPPIAAPALPLDEIAAARSAEDSEALPVVKRAAEIGAGLIRDMLLEVLYDPKIRAAARDLIKEVLAPEVAEKVEMGVLWRERLPGQEKKKRVVIAAGGGFMANKEVLEPLKRFYDLRYYDSRYEPSSRLKAVLEGADVAVIAVSSVSHNAFHIVRAWEKGGGGMLVKWNRGLNSLAAELPEALGDKVSVSSSSAAA